MGRWPLGVEVRLRKLTKLTHEVAAYTILRGVGAKVLVGGAFAEFGTLSLQPKRFIFEQDVSERRSLPGGDDLSHHVPPLPTNTLQLSRGNAAAGRAQSRRTGLSSSPGHPYFMLYGLAKKMLLAQSDAYRQQVGYNSIQW